jgi:hypothetical protein
MDDVQNCYSFMVSFNFIVSYFDFDLVASGDKRLSVGPI